MKTTYIYTNIYTNWLQVFCTGGNAFFESDVFTYVYPELNLKIKLDYFVGGDSISYKFKFKIVYL